MGVYPRVCGGTGHDILHVETTPGLSPRVRGNLWFIGVQGDFNGSIPACAGEPSFNKNKIRGRMVYPRVCGGTTSLLGCTISWTGLSPRVRGNQQRLM